ncbi:MAG: metalloregulator ArsR/SmtB family transcription factor [Actinomycetota bacterium]|nr:metalloregulator ArsR/SmtB family transcription factor [Actinomycetota bacterium]
MLIRMDTQEPAIPGDGQVAEAVDILKLVADPTRLRILWALLHGEHSVNRLAAHVGAQPAAVSQHLAKLRLGHLVRTRREGTHVFYLAQNDHVRRIVEEALFHADHVVRGLADHNETPPVQSHHTESRKPA